MSLHGDAPLWTLFVAALFAPVVVWALWRVQALCVDKVLRAGMFRLLRHQRATYNVVSWFGVLLHEISHAFFLLLGGHGIRGFKVGVDAGHVSPKQVRRGPFGLLSFVVAAMAPMFTAPAAILALLLLLVAPGLLDPVAAGPGLEPAVDAFTETFRAFLPGLVAALVGLDLATAGGLAVFLVAVLALPSARPSHVKGGRGEEDEGDIAVVRAKIRRQPWPFVAFLVVLYGLYFALVPFVPRVYWTGFQLVWGTATVAIVLALAGGVGWWAVSWTGRIQAWAGWIPAVLALAVQVVPRVTPGIGAEPVVINLASLGAFAVATLLLAWALPRRRMKF